jgi:DNA-binding NarL/FixJ family response regulator
MKSVSILIADDHAVVRRGLRALLETLPSWNVCGEALNGSEAVEKAAQLQPDIVILDISMPVLSGVAATTRIHEVAPKSRVLVLTMHSSEELIQSCLSAGAQGYLLKSDAERDLICAVDALVKGKTFFTGAATGVVLESFRRRQNGSHDDPMLKSLTNREKEIAQLLAEGRSNKQVGVKLGIGARTVESHRARIMQKLQLHGISDLVRYAIRMKMIEP